MQLSVIGDLAVLTFPFPQALSVFTFYTFQSNFRALIASLLSLEVALSNQTNTLMKTTSSGVDLVFFSFLSLKFGLVSKYKLSKLGPRDLVLIWSHSTSIVFTIGT